MLELVGGKRKYTTLKMGIVTLVAPIGGLSYGIHQFLLQILDTTFELGR